MAESTVKSCRLREVVFLLHGLGRSPLSMRKMGRHLRQAGYLLVPWRYRSTRAGVELHAERLCEPIRILDNEPSCARIHFVTHSMGGIVVRAALQRIVPRKMGRVVMLAPPNRGSETARLLAPYLTWMLRPLPELSCSQDSYVCRLPTPKGVDFGIIAASHDTRVTIEQTQLEGQTDHTVVPGSHTFIMNRADVCRQTACFLKEGRFAAT